ncbi:MAG TPA: hypothetical protein VHD56_09780, partial [Tepidisphaeraceae bacterium]|nr:hypothetical protein [Tepidisphaeraceae bacterium]
HDIQAAAPLGQPAVVQGFKEGKPELIKSIPRGDREQIFIRAIISTYSSNVNSVIDAPDPNFKTYIRDTAGGSSGPTMDAAPGASADQSGDAQQGGGGDIFALPTAPSTPGAAARRGYVITIKGSSPNKNAYTLIQRTFCENLLNIKPTDKNPKKEYQVVRAVLAKANFVREDGVRLGEIRNAFDQIRIEKARRQAIDSGTGTEAPVQKSLPQIMGPNGQPIEDPAPYMDRLVPGEDVRNDLDFSVVIVVILDPPAPAPATPTALAQ